MLFKVTEAGNQTNEIFEGDETPWKDVSEHLTCAVDRCMYISLKFND